MESHWVNWHLHVLLEPTEPNYLELARAKVEKGSYWGCTFPLGVKGTAAPGWNMVPSHLLGIVVTFQMASVLSRLGDSTMELGDDFCPVVSVAPIELNNLLYFLFQNSQGLSEVTSERKRKVRISRIIPRCPDSPCNSVNYWPSISDSLPRVAETDKP